jgi:polysaccharide biosynthesis/export protein
MRLLKRLAGPLVLVSLLAVLLTPASPVQGQTSGSPVEQILQGLSPDQIGAISQELGGGMGSGQSQGTQGLRTPQPQTEEQESLALQQQRMQLTEQERQRLELQRLSPFLQPEDWVVITIDSNPLPAAPSQQLGLPNGVLGALGGAGGANQQQPGVGFPNIAGLTGATAQSQQSSALLNATQGNGAQSPLAAAQALTPQINSGVTAGGYAPLPPSCSGQPNCDPNQPTRVDLTEEEKQRRQDLIDLIRSKNPYQLSRDGILSLPGFAPIPLGGLTEQLATLRLGVEPALRDLYIRVTKLPLTKQGETALKPFGYDLFDRPISTFAPATNVPVPADYVVGPGDQLHIQMYGAKNGDFNATIGRDGLVHLPELGPVNVAGMNFPVAKAHIESQIERQMIGVHASVTMSDTRSIRVFVLGDAKQPGSYVISGLGTITSALFAAGGVQPIGSLRNIQLKRHGELVRRLDLYDMLIRGDSTDDAKLLSGDVIFIPPVGPTVSVAGEVHRPAIYEIRNEGSITDVVQLAGGLTPEADTTRVELTRIDANLRRVVLHADMSPAGGGATQAVRNGDSLRVARLRPTLDAGIVVQGYLYSPGEFAYRAGMRLTDVLRSVDDLKPNADLHYILIRRELPPDRRVAVLSADLVSALSDPNSDADPVLMPRDRVMVFDLQSSRDRVIKPLLDDIKLQSNIASPEDVIRIDGRANVPGEYPYENGMTLRDLIRAGGGLRDDAYGATAELTRYQVVNGESRQTDLIKVDLAAVLRGDPAANLKLQPFDSLSIKEIVSWTDQETITLRGQVRFPGKYSVKPGETLRSVLDRAGGLTQYAFAGGSVFTRKELREREQKQLDALAGRMQNDIAFVALEGSVANQAGAASALAVGQSLLSQLRSTKAVGRLVINMPAIMRSPVNSQYDVVLRDGDELIVPLAQQQVTVIGEVQTVTSHLYRPGMARDGYIALSGGTTARADKSRIYIVRADGSVAAQGSRWFSTNQDVEPGDTVVVPLNAEHIPPLPFWQAVTQILYNVAVAFLAVHSATST